MIPVNQADDVAGDESGLPVESALCVLQLCGIFRKAAPPHGLLGMDGNDGVKGRVEERTGLKRDTVGMTTVRGKRRVNETHGTVSTSMCEYKHCFVADLITSTSCLYGVVRQGLSRLADVFCQSVLGNHLCHEHIQF